VTERLRIVVTTHVEDRHLAAMAAVDPRIEVAYEADLIPPPRYASDHQLPPIAGDAARDRWVALLESADVLYDFGPAALADRLPGWRRLRWVQTTSAGVGEFARRHGLLAREDVVITTASGVHARPLAEFVLMAVIMFGKDLLRVQADQRRHHWERYAGEEVAGLVAGVVGAGRIGSEVARLLRVLDAHVIGVVRAVDGRTPADVHADELVAVADLDAVLPRLDVLVLATPHTPDTAGLVDARRIGLLPPRAVVVNIARGDVVDEAALADALASGRLRGAALDVFQTEPLPPDSPFWDLPNVLVSPHSASTVAAENDRIVELFCENLRHYLAGEPLRNVLRPELLY
jgi:phosphoglycerate dehydrogenase-like enzyme